MVIPTIGAGTVHGRAEDLCCRLAGVSCLIVHAGAVGDRDVLKRSPLDFRSYAQELSNDTHMGNESELPEAMVGQGCYREFSAMDGNAWPADCGSTKRRAV